MQDRLPWSEVSLVYDVAYPCEKLQHSATASAPVLDLFSVRSRVNLFRFDLLTS